MKKKEKKKERKKVHTLLCTRYWVAKAFPTERYVVYLRHRLKQNGAGLGAHRSHVLESFLHRTEGTDEESEVDLCLLLIRSVDLIRMSDRLASPFTVNRW